ncbi:MAG: DUF3786 domain-containing protein [Deltaproteobacteria bacterium]|nr:DUF3786 domain-containing protein [Deltaproteobacteria bacterium]
MALSVLDVFKVLPQSNCGECGHKSCLAFATAVIKEGEDLEKCHHLSARGRELAQTIKTQQETGIGRRRESVAIAAEALHEKVAPLDFAALAPGLGADYSQEDGRPYLIIPYFGQPLQVFKDELRYPPEVSEDPWDAILLYNYIASQGQQLPTGKWITFQDLPNSVSKVKTQKRLEEGLAAQITGQVEHLQSQAAALGAKPASQVTTADVALVFWPLPRVPILLMFYEADAAEGFVAQTQLLFDAQISSYLDLESTLFLVEKLIARLSP